MGFNSFCSGLRVSMFLLMVTFVAGWNLCAQDATSLPDTTGASTRPAGGGTIENSVVKIFSTVRYPDPYKPWSKESPVDLTGSGVVIEGKRILTNAHVVNYASQVQIQANE